MSVPLSIFTSAHQTYAVSLFYTNVSITPAAHEKQVESLVTFAPTKPSQKIVFYTDIAQGNSIFRHFF